MNAIDSIVAPLEAHVYVFSDEAALHNGIAKVLDRHGVSYAREKPAGASDRFDFLVDNGIVIEAKVDGSLPDALRQVDRYLKHAEVSGAVIASAKQWARRVEPRMNLRDKPVRIVHLKRAAF